MRTLLPVSFTVWHWRRGDDGRYPHDERQDIIRRFEEGATKIIVNVGVLVAGFDSDVRCLIYARPTKSEIRWLQCIGRALRTASGKNAH